MALEIQVLAWNRHKVWQVKLVNGVKRSHHRLMLPQTQRMNTMMKETTWQINVATDSKNEYNDERDHMAD
jgi:hypothetical protein